MVLNHCGPTFQSLQKYFLASKRMLEHVLAWSKTCKYHSEQLVLLLRPLTLQKYYALFKTIVSWNNNDVCIQIQQRCRVIFLYVQSCTWEINKSLLKLNWIKKECGKMHRYMYRLSKNQNEKLTTEPDKVYLECIICLLLFWILDS